MDNHDKPRPREQKQLDCPDNIEPLMNELIVIWNTAELSGRAFGVVEGMCHVRAPRVR
ncbi:hypothetical protein SCH4B_4763 [Ruegeria sp. TrichCH4B]|nr:hypothetical protein SCH4B_4763 [Ruegeria sp. TrichCH4B]